METARAADSIVAREYRYVSPVFQFDPATGSRTPAPARRPHQTIQTCIDREVAAGRETVAAADAKDEKMELPPQNLPNKDLEQLRRDARLDTDASSADVIAKVRELRAASEPRRRYRRACERPGHYVRLPEFERGAHRAQRSQAERSRERAAHTVEDGDPRRQDCPAQRAWRLLTAPPTRAGFASFASKQPSLLGADSGLGGESPVEVGGARFSTRLTGHAARSSACSIRNFWNANADAPIF